MGNQKIEFLAQFDPSVRAAVAFDWEGASTIRLFAPSSEEASIHKFIAYGKAKKLKVTVEIGEEEASKAPKKTGGKGKAEGKSVRKKRTLPGAEEA